jgi:hypothetical protein
MPYDVAWNRRHLAWRYRPETARHWPNGPHEKKNVNQINAPSPAGGPNEPPPREISGPAAARDWSSGLHRKTCAVPLRAGRA